MRSTSKIDQISFVVGTLIGTFIARTIDYLHKGAFMAIGAIIVAKLAGVI